MIVRWPGHVAAPGAARPQFAHAVDLMPTIMAATGLQPPDEVDGIAQQRVDGVSLLSTLEDPAAPEVHRTQYFEMLGSRSIYHEGWKATTDHIGKGVLDEEELAVGSRDFAQDQWELFDLTTDFSEAVDRSADEPETVRRLADLWTAEAERNNVFPISDGLVDRFSGFIPPAWPAGSSRTFLPGGGPVNDESVPMLWGGFRMIAAVDVDGVAADGVIFALGDWFGGYAVFATGGIVSFAFARAVDTLELTASDVLTSGHHEIEVTYALGTDGAARTSDDEGGRRRGRQDRGSGHAAAGSPARRSRTPSRSRRGISGVARPTGRRLLSPAPCTPSASRHPGRPRRDAAAEVGTALHAD